VSGDTDVRMIQVLYYDVCLLLFFFIEIRQVFEPVRFELGSCRSSKWCHLFPLGCLDCQAHALRLPPTGHRKRPPPPTYRAQSSPGTLQRDTPHHPPHPVSGLASANVEGARRPWTREPLQPPSLARRERACGRARRRRGSRGRRPFGCPAGGRIHEARGGEQGG